ncbi:MAG: hypothetical protein P1U89_27690 [Verrucomicrobiales bacterium]|nr:hypothetical protein [Verrucomicrobiales bacterium]
MTRRSLAGLAIFSPAGQMFGQSAATLMTDKSDRETWAWLLKRFKEKEAVKMRGNRLEYIGMANKGPYAAAVMLNKEGHVVKARFDKANFTNDEWSQLAGFKHLIDLSCWHNYKSPKKGEPHPDYRLDHELSGSGLIAFNNHPLQNLNIAGSTFNNFGIEALRQLPNFRKLMAFHTRVDDDGIKLLEGSPHITFLNLGPQFSMRISEKALESIGKMKALVELEFNETRVTWESGLRHLLPLKKQLKRVKLDKVWLEDGTLEKAREAFPDTTFEYSAPSASQIDEMKRHLV